MNENKYKKGDFGYWWTVELGNEDIDGKEYSGDIKVPWNIKSLKGCPKKVIGNFCVVSQIYSLKHAPEYVSENFDCMGCNRIKSLKGAPEYVGGDFACSGCDNLLSLRGAPKIVEGCFFYGHCPKLKDISCISKIGRDFLDD